MRILIAEDESISRKALVKMILSSNPNYIVVEVENGEKAKQSLEKERFDLVIADIRMPICDGLALGKWTKEHYPNTEISYLSGYAEFDYAIEAMRQGAIEYMLKPIEEAKLHSMFEKVEAKIGMASDRIVDTINTYIRNSGENQINVSELCQKVLFLSPSYVSRYYHQATGHTIAWAIKDSKLTLAAEYLRESELSVSEIATHCGYQSLSSFIQSFSAKYAVTPSAYRQLVRQDRVISKNEIKMLDVEKEDLDTL